MNTEGGGGGKSSEIEMTLREACGLSAIEAENDGPELGWNYFI